MKTMERTEACSPAYTPGVGRPPAIRALTSVRFFAALHVAVYHMVRPFSLWGPVASVAGAGYVGVSFFFVLSGFILTYSHAREYELGRGRAAKFWVARFARLYPVYLLSMVLAAYVDRVMFAKKAHWIAFAAYPVMMQSWSIRTASIFNVPAWSLSIEAFFYLVFPFVLMRLRPRSWTAGALAVVGFWLLALVAPVACVWLYPGVAWHEGVIAPGMYRVYQVRRMPVLALPEFLAGVSLGWLYVRFGLSARMAAIFTVVGAAGLGLALALSDRMPFVMLHNGLLIPLCGLLILGLCGDNWMTRMLSHPVLVLLGEASFALYLMHFLFNDWVIASFGASASIAACVWKLALLIPGSVVLHLCVERPCRRAILEWFEARHPGQLRLQRRRPIGTAFPKWEA